MPFDPDDPRITAYALDEIDEADKPLVEALIADDPEAQALVADIRATARLLTEQLHAEPTPILGPNPNRAMPEPAVIPRARTHHGIRWLGAGVAIAASVLGMVPFFKLTNQ